MRITDDEEVNRLLEELTAARQRIAELEDKLYSEREAAMSRAEAERAAHKDIQDRLCMVLDAAKRIEAGKPIVMRLSESESVATLAARNAELEAVVDAEKREADLWSEAVFEMARRESALEALPASDPSSGQNGGGKEEP